MLASALAMLFAKDKKVIAVDCDVDAPNLHLWLGERGLKSASTDWKIEKISTNELPIIDHEKCNLCGKCVEICAFDALLIQPDGLARRRLNPSGLELNDFFCEGCGACEVICPQKAITMQPVQNAEIRIKKDVHGFPLVSAQLYPGQTGSGKIVEEIKKRAEKFDHEIMILDSPAGTGCPVIAALKDADFAVLVTEPTPAAFSDLDRVLTVVDHFQIPFGIVINKWDINPPLTQKIEKEFSGKIRGKITYDKKIFEAIANLTPIMKTGLPAVEEIRLCLSSLTKKQFLY